MHLSSCGVCLVDSGVSVPHFVAAFSSVFVGIFRVVFPGFLPLGIPKVHKNTPEFKSDRSRQVKSFPTSICLRNLDWIQPRTGRRKFLGHRGLAWDRSGMGRNEAQILRLEAAIQVSSLFN